MGEYLENKENSLVQVFAEFETFLYLIRTDAHNNALLSKILLESKRIHIRMLCDFFSTGTNDVGSESDTECKKKKKHDDDDLHSTDFIPGVAFDVQISSALRKEISKGTAHLTRQRGTICVPKTDYIDACCSIMGAINRFMREIDKGNMTDLCRRELEDADAAALRTIILRFLIEDELLNALDDLEIDT